MANTTPIARSQISIDGPTAVVDGWEISTRTSSAALTLRDESHLTKVVVRSTDGAPVSAQLPANGSARHAGDTIQIGSAPSEWYLMAKGATTASLVSGLDLPGASGYAAWTDVTHGRALVRLTGADSAKINLGAWIKEGKYGKFFSIKISTYKKPDQPKQNSTVDEDLPF